MILQTVWMIYSLDLVRTVSMQQQEFLMDNCFIVKSTIYRNCYKKVNVSYFSKIQ